MILLLVAVIAVVALIVMRSSDSLISSNKSVRVQQISNSVAATIMARVRQGLGGTSSCASLNSALASFRRFGAGAAPYKVTLAGNGVQSGCLLTQTEGARIKKLALTVSESSVDSSSLSRQALVHLDLSVAGIAGMPDKKVSVNRGYSVRVATLDYFNVIFKTVGSPLVSTAGANLHFQGSTLYAGGGALRIDDIYDTTGTLAAFFQYPFFVQSNALAMGSNVNWSKLRAVFNNGIETGVMTGPTLSKFLPSGKPAWNQGFDYYYLANNLGYPLPEVTGGTSAIECDTATSGYNPARGKVAVVPSPQGLQTASQSCGPDTGNPPEFLFMQPTSDLTIKLTPTDNMFCGLVAARTLHVQLSGAGTYAIFGNFYIDRIQVDGGAGADLYIYNPRDGVFPAVSLPDGIGTLQTQFHMIQSSTGWNFSLPIASASSVQLQPRAPINYMATCAAAGVYQFAPSYTALGPTTPGWSALVNNTAGALYLVGDAL